MKKDIQELKSAMKAKVKECGKLRSELEVARTETQVESDSKLTVQSQLKNEIKEILTENSGIKSKIKSKEEKMKNLEEKVAAADKEKISLLSKHEAAKRSFKKEMDNQKGMYKEKIANLEAEREELNSSTHYAQTVAAAAAAAAAAVNNITMS